MKTLVIKDSNVQAQYSTINKSIKHDEKWFVPKNNMQKLIHIITEPQDIHLNIEVDACAHHEHWLINLSDTSVNYHLTIALTGPNATTKVKAIILGKNKANLQHQLRIDHLADQTQTHILMHAIADDQSKIMFDGYIYVKEKIKGVDANELLKSVLLTNQAEVDVKPILEIYSNEVACSHGASVGDLDEDALFYLQSRGFSLIEAKEILLKSFATQFLKELENSHLQSEIEALILAKLKQN